MSDQDKIHTILLEKIAGLEKQVKDRQDLIDYKNSQMAKAHLAITQNFGAGASTQEGLVLDVRIKAIAQDVHEKMDERNTCNAKLWEEATPYLDEDTKGKSWPQVIKILAAKLRASDEQNRIRHIYQEANKSLGECVDGLRKEKDQLGLKLRKAEAENFNLQRQLDEKLEQADKDIKHYADASDNYQRANQSLGDCVDKLRVENAELGKKLKAAEANARVVEQIADVNQRDRQQLHDLVVKAHDILTSAGVARDGGSGLCERIEALVGVCSNGGSAGAHLLLTQHGIPQGSLKDRVLHVLQTCHKLNTEIEDANNFLSKGWGIPEDASLCKRINHLAQGYILKIDELGLKLSQERTTTDGALRAIRDVNDILDNVGVLKRNILTVRIGDLLENHRQEVEELKRTQLARREKAKAHKDGELGRAQDTLKYCQKHLGDLYPEHRMSLRELVDNTVRAIRYVRGVHYPDLIRENVTLRNKLKDALPAKETDLELATARARIEKLEQNQKEQEDAYGKQWDSIHPTLAVLGAVEELPPCWPDIILELADRLTKTKEKLEQCRTELHKVESVCPVAHGPTWERVQKLAEMYKAARDRISYLETERANRPGDSFPSWRDAL